MRLDERSYLMNMRQLNIKRFLCVNVSFGNMLDQKFRVFHNNLHTSILLITRHTPHPVTNGSPNIPAHSSPI